MSFTRSDLYQIRLGYNHQVGQIPDAIAQTVGWRCPFVYLSADSLAHIAKKHPDVTDFDLLHIPLAIKLGLIVHEQKDRRRLLIAYRPSDHPERLYRCVLKEAGSGVEIWVSTFHRFKPNQLKNMLKRGKKLREHK